MPATQQSVQALRDKHMQEQPSFMTNAVSLKGSKPCHIWIRLLTAINFPTNWCTTVNMTWNLLFVVLVNSHSVDSMVHRKKQVTRSVFKPRPTSNMAKRGNEEKGKKNHSTKNSKQQKHQITRSALASEKASRKRDPRERYLDELLS